jgi:hypothetical protein
MWTGNDASGFHSDFGNGMPPCCGIEPTLRVEDRYIHNGFVCRISFVCRTCANAGQPVEDTGYPNINYDRAAQHWRLSDHEISAKQQTRSIEWMFGPSVEARNALQKRGRVHPFTCGNATCRETLTAVDDGWLCDKCGYTQKLS